MLVMRLLYTGYRNACRAARHDAVTNQHALLIKASNLLDKTLNRLSGKTFEKLLFLKKKT